MSVKEQPYIIDFEKEKLNIKNAYRRLLRAARRITNKNDRKKIRKAFVFAVEAHKNDRRKSGEPYIFHPISVAQIVADEIGLGVTSIICALLHDTVEDTPVSLDDIENEFGSTVRKIIDGLTKIDEITDIGTSKQAENFKKMLLTLSDDVRVILIKLADRLHNMRTLDAMRHDKQLKIASETLYLYAPLAHRLGLYLIKSELEDLSLKYKEAEVYHEITQKLAKSSDIRKRFIRRFYAPIKKKLIEEGFKFEILGRTKSVFSILNKMKKKKVNYEEVYDLFAIRIILDTPEENEKAECWKVYSIVTDFYHPNPDRLRDWISTPKLNGYESLHTTVMSPTGQWVEVQIRTQRMHEVAEKGFAAHWKYKDHKAKESNLDTWISRIREMLSDDDEDALDFISDFKLDLFADEIYVFTPNGDLKSLPVNATALDFAYEIHTQVGNRCSGVKINQKLEPLSHKLRSGDQVEVITSNKQKPRQEWLSYAITSKARQGIRRALKEDLKILASNGKEILERRFRNMKVTFNSENITTLQKHYDLKSTTELYSLIAQGKINIKKLKNYTVKIGVLTFTTKSKEPQKETTLQKFISKPGHKHDTLIIGEKDHNFDYKFAPCCNPIPGDPIFGFITINDGIKVHRTSCPNAIQLMSNYAYRVINASWATKEHKEFMAKLHFSGVDDIGLVNKITTSISNESNINIKSLSFDTNDGIFNGEISILIKDTIHLADLIESLKIIEGVFSVERIKTEDFYT
ncbi:MAG: RelA/SpoT family protein [Epsilonproteobacteria bacterium]|nr:MAG: RelA/SpoT family protein [Campylobacterota bacterium]